MDGDSLRNGFVCGNRFQLQFGRFPRSRRRRSHWLRFLSTAALSEKGGRGQYCYGQHEEYRRCDGVRFHPAIIMRSGAFVVEVFDLPVVSHDFAEKARRVSASGQSESQFPAVAPPCWIAPPSPLLPGIRTRSTGVHSGTTRIRLDGNRLLVVFAVNGQAHAVGSRRQRYWSAPEGA